jgi:hypothetical protein
MFIRDPNFFHFGSRAGTEFFPSRISDLHQKNLSILTQKIAPGIMIRVVHPGSRSPDPDLLAIPDPDPGVKKASDSGSATMECKRQLNNLNVLPGAVLVLGAESADEALPARPRLHQVPPDELFQVTRVLN